MLRIPSLHPRSKRGRWQTGQSIIVLAIGFIALLGFVGIVTDVSLLFVRYSSLSRAVDAAAVAAAGQMRRVPDDVAAGVNGEAASVAQLGLAARQFIEVYGLNPSTVLVETCRVQRYRDLNGNPVDRAGVPLFLVGGAVNPAANPEDVDRFQSLCTDAEEKLVRVTAQIDAPTTFLSLLGYRTVTLTVDAISQTAVLDVALIFDVSETMLTETQYSDWQAAGYGWRYLPPRSNQVRSQAAAMAGVDNADWGGCWDWRFIVTQSQADITGSGFNAIRPDGTTFHCPSTLYDAENTNPALNVNFGTNTFPTPYRWLPAGVDPLTQQEPPLQACRVRIWPESAYNRYTLLNQWLVDEYIKNDGSDPAPFADEAALREYFMNGTSAVTQLAFDGFVPTFNYYGCCNDPNGDWDFGDLVCQPFGEARDAAQGFLDRLDFLRGDRIAYITYDRRATVIDPDGAAGAQIPMMESQNNITDGVGTVIRRGAEEVLNQVIGVRAETTFYDDTDDNGIWDCIYAGTSVGGAGQCLTNLDDIQNETIYGITNHPVKGACPFDMVAMDAQYTGPYGQYRWDQATSGFIDRSSDYNTNDTPIDDITSNLAGAFPSWGASVAYPPGRPLRNHVYEYRASCAGGNIGGALGAASNMLYLNGRREGAVWLMVLLSSGASGASDAMGRFTVHGTVDGTHPDGMWTYGTPHLGSLSDPFHIGDLHTDAVRGITAQVYEPIAGDYGSYGLCPYGLIDAGAGINRPGEILLDGFPPFCLDLQPDTRTFCQDAAVANPPNSVALDNSTNPYCEEFYDTDDYARDWADYIGVANLNTGTGLTARSGSQLLPSIFTIGFGLTYDAQINDQGQITGFDCPAGDYDCQRGYSGDPHSLPNQLRIADYLGEELLRYIADIGDNLRIDSDYWQYFMGTRIGNGVTSLVSPDWGPRGSCEIPVSQLTSGVQQQDYSPLPPRTSCGNYYVAVTASDLNLVFNEIASRMFTRLSE